MSWDCTPRLRNRVLNERLAEIVGSGQCASGCCHTEQGACISDWDRTDIFLYRGASRKQVCPVVESRLNEAICWVWPSRSKSAREGSVQPVLTSTPCIQTDDIPSYRDYSSRIQSFVDRARERRQTKLEA